MLPSCPPAPLPEPRPLPGPPEVLTTGEDIREGIGEGIDDGEGVGLADNNIGGDGIVLETDRQGTRITHSIYS